MNNNYTFSTLERIVRSPLFFLIICCIYSFILGRLSKKKGDNIMTTSSEILLNIHLNHEECILLKEILKQVKSSNCSNDTETFIADMLDGINDFLEYN